MSIDTCQTCGNYVDTDHDCEAYELTSPEGASIQLDFAMCPSCRESDNAFKKAAREYDKHPHFVKYARPKELELIRKYAGYKASTAAIIEELLDNPDKADEILEREKDQKAFEEGLHEAGSGV